jgi:hypothetical protein
VDGLPPTLLALAAQTARAAGHEQATAEQGPWRITLDLPSYFRLRSTAHFSDHRYEKSSG